MRQDELDLVQTLPPPPILNARSPSVTTVTQSVGEDDRGGVRLDGREDEWWSVSQRHVDGRILTKIKESRKSMSSGATRSGNEDFSVLP